MPGIVDMNLKRLRKECKNRNIINCEKLKKDELIYIILRDMNVNQLRQECKDEENLNCKKMKKDDLVSNILKSYFEEKTVKELRQLSKEKRLTGYSKQKKSILIASLIRENHKIYKRQYVNMTVKELKDICREKGISGYSNKRKNELIELCYKGEDIFGELKRLYFYILDGEYYYMTEDQIKEDMMGWDVKDLKQLCKVSKIKYSGKSKKELVDICSEAIGLYW